MRVLFFLFLIIPNVLFAQIVSDDGKFLGADVEQLDFYEADSLIALYAYKKPVKTYRSVKWRSGGCSLIRTNTYFLKARGKKFEIKLRGSGAHYQMVLTAKRRSKISFQGVSLGYTKLGALDLQFSADEIDLNFDDEGRDYFILPYKGLYILAYGNEEDLESGTWKNKKVTKLIWKK